MVLATSLWHSFFHSYQHPCAKMMKQRRLAINIQLKDSFKMDVCANLRHCPYFLTLMEASMYPRTRKSRRVHHRFQKSTPHSWEDWFAARVNSKILVDRKRSQLELFSQLNNISRLKRLVNIKHCLSGGSYRDSPKIVEGRKRKVEVTALTKY